MSRPHGEFRMAVVQALGSGPATTRQVAARAQLSVGVAQYTLRNLCQAEVATASQIRVDGVKRPVPLYALSVMAAESPGDGGAHLAQHLAQCWADFV